MPRSEWRLRLPAMRRLAPDGSGIPTGSEEPFGSCDEPLAQRSWDDGFALESEQAAFELSGAGLAISVELLAGYRFAQVYAPADKDFIALEPMTAPTSALTTGRDLALAPPGGRDRAAFRIRVEGT
jgi:galactose mutarotase-like enzyme